MHREVRHIQDQGFHVLNSHVSVETLLGTPLLDQEQLGWGASNWCSSYPSQPGSTKGELNHLLEMGGVRPQG